MKTQAGYVERIDGRNYLVIPVQAGAKLVDVMKRANGALDQYNQDNKSTVGFQTTDGRQTRKFPYCRLHALLPDRVIYEVEC